MNKQSPERIKDVAMEFDNAIEAKDIRKVVAAFADDCEIELLGLTLEGKTGVKKWIEWLFQNIPEIEFEPVTIMVDGNVFFEEFIVTTRLPSGKTIRSKQAEVLVYEDYKIKSLRLYFDRLDFSDLIARGFISQRVVGYVKTQSLRGLV
ncbi:nuclear transport factor 2 family protein [Candidatus Thorarchaeota archaeon]|nr:MAG: nuclear transport factor 2 family protein [Candidatus Thorarchaeota archaeon]